MKHNIDTPLVKVPMLSNQSIILRNLQPCVLKTLDSAHQGTYSMMMRAKEIFQWTWFRKDANSQKKFPNMSENCPLTVKPSPG